MSGDNRIKTLFFVALYLSYFHQTSTEQDFLRPYNEHHGPLHSNRYVRDIQHTAYGNITYETYPSNTDVNTSYVEIHILSKNIGKLPYNKKYIHGHVSIIRDPSRTVSVLEPGSEGGCKKGSLVRATVQDTASSPRCLLAVNAGFFDVKKSTCLGNIVSNERLVQDTAGIQNAHFGIQKDKSLFFGYLSEEDLISKHFLQLVGGVIWLVRNGSVYVDDSVKAEFSETETTGTMKRFVEVVSARTAVGHDSAGRLIIVQIDGKTDQQGVTLYEIADLMKSLGAVNAINLDGGGSCTTVINGTVANYVSDECENKQFKCPRKVSTILCVHEPRCLKDCSNHGRCIQGSCRCHGNWNGDGCERLQCGATNCSSHGLCTEDGCECYPGYMGNSCNVNCPVGQFGRACQNLCRCHHRAVCHPTDGACVCPPGYVGQFCENKCEYGFYGAGCRSVCLCHQSCSCHHVTGSCNISTFDVDLTRAARCLADDIIKTQHLIPDASDQYQKMVISVSVISILAAVSLIINISLLCKWCLPKTKNRQQFTTIKNRWKYSDFRDTDADDEGDDLESDLELMPRSPADVKVSGQAKVDMMSESEEEIT